MFSWPTPIETYGSRLVLAQLGAAALAATLAGCGGGGESTLAKTEVIERGAAICDQARQRVDALPQPSEHPFARGSSPAEQERARKFLAVQAEAFRSVHDGFRGLRAPEEQRETLDGFIDRMGTVAEELDAASTAASRQVESRAEQAYGLFAEAGEQASEYGFPQGTCGAGGSG